MGVVIKFHSPARPIVLYLRIIALPLPGIWQNRWRKFSEENRWNCKPDILARSARIGTARA
jgi:hypothetical protein